jgi:hypothetical protein
MRTSSRRSDLGPSNSRPSPKYETPRVGDRFELAEGLGWILAEVKEVHERWIRPTRLDGTRGKPSRGDDLVVLAAVSGPRRIFRRSSWQLSRAAFVRPAQGRLFCP